MTRDQTTRIGLTLAAAALCSAGTAHAALLAEDQFLTGGSNYATSSNILGQGPATFGFTGNWLNFTGTAAPVDTGLTYGGLVTDGGALALSGGNNRTGRLIDSPVTASTTGTVYLSFLMELSAVSNQYKALELHNGGFDDNTNRNFRLGNGGGANGFSNTDYGFRIAGGSNQLLGAGDTDTNLFVVRFDLSDAAASDSVTVYRNPTNLISEAANTGVTLAGQDIAFDRISVAMFTGELVTFDEFRLGTTFNSVVPIPEPGSLALLGAGGLCLLARRRR